MADQVSEVDFMALVEAFVSEMEQGLEGGALVERRSALRLFLVRHFEELIDRLRSPDVTRMRTLVLLLLAASRRDEYEDLKNEHYSIWLEEKEALFSFFLETLSSPVGKADWALLFLLVNFRNTILAHLKRRLNPSEPLLRPPSAFVYSMQ
jgi:hypothetical protein